MRIAIASDHGGYKLKEWIKEHLDSTEEPLADSDVICSRVTPPFV